MRESTKPRIKGELSTGRFVVPFRVYGSGAETLVCLNGVQQSMAIWGSFVHRFSRSYAIVLFDFPNQGKGKVVSGPADVTLAEQVDILDAVVEACGAKEAVTLCSASWGGVVAAGFAVNYPQKVKRLVMAGLGTRPNKKMYDTIKDGVKIPLENRKEIAETLIKSFGQELQPQLKEKIIGQFEGMSKEALEAFYRHGVFVLSAGALGDAVELGRIRCKTVLLRGEKDTIIDEDDVAFLASQIPGSQVRTIKGAGHFLHLENDALLDVYAQILKGER